MVLIIVVLLLLLCSRASEPKIVYSRPVVTTHNDTSASATESAVVVNGGGGGGGDDDDDDESATTEAAVATTAITDVPLKEYQYAEDSHKSMSTKTNVVGVQFYAPPTIVHGTTAAGAVDVLGRHYNPHYHQPHRHPHQPTAFPYRHPQHHYRTPWDEHDGANTDGLGGPILMKPLLAPAAYDDLSTARYSQPATQQHQQQQPPPLPRRHLQQQTQPIAARVVKYTDPAAASLAFLAAEADDTALLDNLPALQLAMQHAAAGGVVKSAANAMHPTLPPNIQPHHHYQHAVVKQPAPSSYGSTALHQLVHQQKAPHQPPPPHHHHYPHHHHHHHRPQHHHATATGRYTQVPFLYNLPTPPAQRNLAPAEYDLVTRFNRLLRQRGRDDDKRGGDGVDDDDDSNASRHPVMADDLGVNADEDDEDETTARPVTKPKKTKKTTRKKKKKTTRKKKKKKKKKLRPTTPQPAPVEEEQEEDDDGGGGGVGQLQTQQEQDENDQPTADEQESQNVIASQLQLPDSTIIHESEADFPNEINEPSQLSEQFGGDLTFDDGNGERVEFQLHGLGGPESYKFGYDTGKGTNRQFRYEERDSDGNVHGHYGYLDGEGKMQVYNYSSHPEHGFHSQKSETLET